MTIQSISPATGEVLERYDEMTPAAAQEVVAAVCTKGRLVERLFVTRMDAAKMGDPLREDTEIGPLARHDLRAYGIKEFVNIKTVVVA